MIVSIHQAFFRRRFGARIFLGEADILLGDLPHVAVYFDKILVTRSKDEDHWKNVSDVLKRLQDAGLRLKPAKCEFMKDRVEYLGHIFTAKGLHPTPRNVKAIFPASRSQDVKALYSYMGLIKVCREFIPRLSAVFSALNGLLVPGTPCAWTFLQEEAFGDSKKL